MIDYQLLRHELKTGDIILTSGTTLFSRAIRWMTKSYWSHVGMIVRADQWDFVLMWESTTGVRIKDVESTKFNHGVQLVPLSERLKAYDGTFAIRQLNRPLSESETQTLSRFRHEVSGRRFDYNMVELLRAAWDSGIMSDNHEELSSLFCSELIAETFQALGFLDEDRPSNEYVPSDFSTEQSLPLKRGVSLGEEIMVRW